MRLRRALLLAWACLGPVFLAEKALAASFTMKDQISLAGPWIHAGQVLEPAPDSMTARVKIRKVGMPGSSVELSRELLLLKLKDAHLGGELPDIQGKATKVLASSRMLPGSEVQAFAEKYLRERLNSLSGVAAVELSPSSQVRDLVVPDKPVTFRISPRPGQNWKGDVVLLVGLLETDDDDATEIPVGGPSVSFKVRVKQSQLVAARLLKRGELLGPENTQMADLDSTYDFEDGYSSLEGVAGMKLKLPIPAGKAIKPSALERPFLVKRGDVVKLIVRSGSISVATSALAQRDGALGDSIPVEVQDGKKLVQARVLDSGTVVSDAR
jgi:flagella basal body P-ring formation protein FlgA